LPGLDGRKMSKSYDNTIPLFASSAQLQKLIANIKTDSRAPGEPKDTEGSALFQIYQAFASPEETAAFAQEFAQGISWAAAKEKLHARIDQEIAPMRARYQHLMEHPQEVEAMLLQGAIKARAVATPFMARLRQAVGLRRLAAQSTSGSTKAAKTASAAFKQYREADGQFYFKLLDAKGALLLQSTGFANPKEAAQVMAQLKAGGASALPACQAFITTMGDAAALDGALESLRASAA